MYLGEGRKGMNIFGALAILMGILCHTAKAIILSFTASSVMWQVFFYKETNSVTYPR